MQISPFAPPPSLPVWEALRTSFQNGFTVNFKDKVELTPKVFGVPVRFYCFTTKLFYRWISAKNIKHKDRITFPLDLELKNSFWLGLLRKSLKKLVK
jgi:hypothetical protein